MSSPSVAADGGTRRAWLWPLLIALLAVVASLSGVGNQYVQDDIAVIWKNGEVHHLSGVGRLFTHSYWPPPFIPALYRPFASVVFMAQWLAGGGSPIAFRVVSYALYGLTCVGFFRLARVRLPLVVAAVVAALFAVHPVHVEAVAVAVNQSELLVGLLACVMVVLYVRERSRGGPLPTRTQLLLAGLYLTACLMKENALILPGLLIAAEVLLVPTDESIRDRLSFGRRPLLLLMLVAVVFYWVRTQVLGGSLAGTFVAEGLEGLTMSERAMAMLAVVPQWFRLLFWPAHLQADYSPAEIVAQTAWGPEHTLGALLLAASVFATLLSWRRAPMVAFGLVWCAIALFPTSNVLVPTGIVVAERTLFLPSIGMMLAVGGIAALVVARATPRARLLLGAATGVLLALGMFRSITRHPVWHDQFGLWYHTANEDAPRSFHAHEALAEAYFQIGVGRMSEQEYQLAIQFAPPRLSRPMMEYGDRLRQSGFCYPAAQQYRKVIALRPNHIAARTALIACALDLGFYREAAYQARMATAYDWQRLVFQRALFTADSALRVGAPPGTVRLKVSPSDSLGSYVIVGKQK